MARVLTREELAGFYAAKFDGDGFCFSVSAFSIVRVVCRNVKRWRPGNQIERWVGSGLVVAEKQFRRIDGHRALPGLLAALEADLKLPKSAARVA